MPNRPKAKKAPSPRTRKRRPTSPPDVFSASLAHQALADAPPPELRADERGVLRMIFSWWHQHGDWPKRDDLGRNRNELVAPDRYEPALMDVSRRQLVETIGGTSRLGLKLAAQGMFAESARSFRHLVTWLDLVKADIEGSPLSAVQPTYTVRQVCSRLRVSVEACRRLMRVAAVDRLGAAFFDPWRNEPQQDRSTLPADVRDAPAFTLPTEWRSLAGANDGLDYLQRIHNVGRSTGTLTATTHAGPADIVLVFGSESSDVLFDGLGAHVPSRGVHLDTLRVLWQRNGEPLPPRDVNAPSPKSPEDSYRRRITEIRDALDEAARRAGLASVFTARCAIASVRGNGYRLLRQLSDGTRLIDPEWG